MYLILSHNIIKKIIYEKVNIPNAWIRFFCNELQKAGSTE